MVSLFYVYQGLVSCQHPPFPSHCLNYVLILSCILSSVHFLLTNKTAKRRLGYINLNRLRQAKAPFLKVTKLSIYYILVDSPEESL